MVSQLSDHVLHDPTKSQVKKSKAVLLANKRQVHNEVANLLKLAPALESICRLQY